MHATMYILHPDGSHSEATQSEIEAACVPSTIQRLLAEWEGEKDDRIRELAAELHNANLAAVQNKELTEYHARRNRKLEAALDDIASRTDWDRDACGKRAADALASETNTGPHSVAAGVPEECEHDAARIGKLETALRRIDEEADNDGSIIICGMIASSALETIPEPNLCPHGVDLNATPHKCKTCGKEST